MSNKRYIEINSTYRNRNLWPDASEFEIPISQTGVKEPRYALDTVSLEAPLTCWSSNCFALTVKTSSTTTTTTTTLLGTIASSVQTENSFSNTPSCFIISSGNDLPISPSSTTVEGTYYYQQKKNYYLNAVISIKEDAVTKEPVKRKIIYYEYLGRKDVGFDLAKIQVDYPFPDECIVEGNIIAISDPTDKEIGKFFVPCGAIGKNSYIDYILYNETKHEYTKILGYSSETHLLTVDINDPNITKNDWSDNNNFCIRKEIPCVYGIINNSSSSKKQMTIVPNTDVQLSKQDQYYVGYFIRILPNKYGYFNYETDVSNIISTPETEMRKITEYTYSGGNGEIKICPGFTEAPSSNAKYELLRYSYDNFNPLFYNGSTVSQQQMVCYEIELLDLVLPNSVLSVGFGSRISFYPYVYVELNNITSSSAGNRNIIYSNNPNSTKMLFRAAIDDVPNPTTSSFIKIDGDGTVQTVKFKPNDNLKFSVRLPNGELFKTVLNETYSPQEPSPLSQISALFSIKRL